MKIKLGIGICNLGSIHVDTAMSLFRMLKDFPYDYDVISKRGSILHHNRESIIKIALENKCTHLLFVDTDMVFNSDAALKLLNLKKDIIGVQVNTKQDPPKTIVNMSLEKWERLRDTGESLSTCDSVGTGFMLIDLKIMKKLPKPWFFWKSNDKGEIVESEDYWFCRQAREAGYEVWVDLTIPVGHIGDKIY